MRRLLFFALLVSFAACRGEKVPRDYQNAPPSMTNAPTTSSQTPTANGMPGAAPEPNKGVEGPNPPHDPKLKDQAPITGTTATMTTATTTTTTTTATTTR